MRIALIGGVVLLGVVASGCGDDDPDRPVADAGVQPDATVADAGPDGGTIDTFAAFVIDLVENRTADDTEPVPIDFSLPDDEAPDSFDVLFEE